MFTGLIQTKGKLISSSIQAQGAQFKIATDMEDLQLGESIAINGACLTVINFQNKKWFQVEASKETLNKTNLGKLKENDALNLERALMANQKLGGHFVTGHIDCFGTLMENNNVGEYIELTISYPKEFEKHLVNKGSIAVDGISLTINQINLEKNQFLVTIIPHTLQETNLADLKVGQKLNLEFDLIGKYILKAIEPYNQRGGNEN